MSAARLIFVKVSEMSHFCPLHFIQIESILEAILSMQTMCDMLGGKTSAVTEKKKKKICIEPNQDIIQ